MASNVIKWEELKPRILQDLADGKTQQQIRQGLAGGRVGVSISKSQLETQLKHWKYRNNLHEAEWRVVSHRISKRRKAGKPASQVLVNGFTFNEKKVAKAVNRYDLPTLTYRTRTSFHVNIKKAVELTERPASPQIPPNLGHHLIEIRTPPLTHLSIQLQPPVVPVAQKQRESVALRLSSMQCAWPRTPQWMKVEKCVGQFVARFFLPKFQQDEKFSQAVYKLGRNFLVSQGHEGDGAFLSSASRQMLLPDEGGHFASGPYDSISTDTSDSNRALGGQSIHTVFVKTLVGLLSGLANQSLGDDGRKTLVSMVEGPAWHTVLPHLKKSLLAIDSSIIEAIAEGLLKASISMLHPKILEFSLALGANPTQRIRRFDNKEKCFVLRTPLIALCSEYSKSWPFFRWKCPSYESLIPPLLEADPKISDSALLWIIRAGFHAMAEAFIRNCPERITDFAIAVADLEDGDWLSFNAYDPVTPLLVACSDMIPSPEKLSLIRCLLERGATADLRAMIAAAGACDREAICLLYQHGAPVDGFIPDLGSPLLAACKATLWVHGRQFTDWNAIPILMNLAKSQHQDANSWDMSPLHILACAEEHQVVQAALNLLIQQGANISRRVGPSHFRSFRCMEGWWGFTVSRTEYTPETALEYAIYRSRWTTATQLLSADYEFTGREILFIVQSSNPRLHAAAVHHVDEIIAQERLEEFVGKLLAMAPTQAAAKHCDGLTVLQRAILYEVKGLIRGLFKFGVRPMPSDFLYMLCDRIAMDESAQLCGLSSSIQMKLLLEGGSLRPSIADARIFRRVLAFAHPGVVRHVLDGFPDVYDSEGLCYVVARILTKDKISYIYTETELMFGEQAESLDAKDLQILISRRATSNTHEHWEATAVVLAARAGRTDILRILIGSSPTHLKSSGLIPAFLLKEVLTCDIDNFSLSEEINDWNMGSLGVWIRYCQMDNPHIRCSPLTAAATVVPQSTAEKLVDLLLTLGFHPDGWTVLLASCQGRLSILRRLKILECWPYILRHPDRPGWCPTALQAAIYNNRISTVRFLLDEGDFLNLADQSPRKPFCYLPLNTLYMGNFDTVLPKTALQHAASQEDMELVAALISSGADVNAPASADSGATALQTASVQGSIPMVQYLIDQGADPHAPGAAKHGRTALQGAAEHGRKDVVELLLAKGEAFWHREQLVEAVFCAEQNAHHAVASVLRQKMIPEWGPADEEALDMLQENWETDSQNTVGDEYVEEIELWKKTFEDLPEMLEVYESISQTGGSYEEPHAESPEAVEQDDPLPSHEIDCWAGAEGNADFYVNHDLGFLDDDLRSFLIWDDGAWGQLRFWGDAQGGDVETLPGDF